MIQLKEIKRKENKIVCIAFLEECTEPLKLVFDINTKDFEQFDYPKGYEWCKSHIAHARRFFAKSESLPTEKFMAWG